MSIFTTRPLVTPKPVAYVYRLTYLDAKPGEPRYYIGVRSARRAHTIYPWTDLGRRYFTSSRVVEPLFRAHPAAFDQKILGIFRSYKHAWLFEQRLLKRVGVPFNAAFFNMSVVTPDGIVGPTGIMPFSYLNNCPVKDVAEFSKTRIPHSISMRAYYMTLIKTAERTKALRKRYGRL